MATFTTEQLNHVADILMAAALADGELEKAEGSMVRAIVAAFAGTATLPAPVEARIRDFDIKTFDLDHAAKAIALGDKNGRRALLQLVAKVTESDEVHDLSESNYIVKVARAIGASPDDYAGLTIALIDPSIPPPVPAAAKKKG